MDHSKGHILMPRKRRTARTSVTIFNVSSEPIPHIPKEEEPLNVLEVEGNSLPGHFAPEDSLHAQNLRRSEEAAKKVPYSVTIVCVYTFVHPCNDCLFFWLSELASYTYAFTRFISLLSFALVHSRHLSSRSDMPLSMDPTTASGRADRIFK